MKRCCHCGQGHRAKTVTCPRCLDRLRSERARRAALGLCTVPGCVAPADPDRLMCSRHRRQYQELCRAYRRRKRETRAVRSIAAVLDDFDAVL